MTTLRLMIAFKTMVSIWVYIIGGDGTQRGANAIHERFFYMKDLNWKTPKLITNVGGIFLHFQTAGVQEIIDKSFGFDMQQLKKLNMQSMHMQLYAQRNCSKIHALYFSREGDKTS
ncbi:unnamed protein product [Sphagnum jensenii]|uniref:Uncharacterized protein n=1 Tax=Sphagnum jensenii TaxID=128206 RepID=A0ABP0WHC5_9BRYO